MNKLLLLFAAAITFTSCDNADSSNELGNKTLLLEKKKIECSFEEYSDRVFVKTNIAFDLDAEEFCSWIDYKAGVDSIFIDLDKNWSTDERTCNLILTNDQYSLSDTFIIQKGYKSNENNGGSSGNGGNSNNGNNSGGNGSNNGNSGGNIDNGGSSVSRQCAAYTKKGKHCKRTASKGSIYCWQHK